VGNPSQAEEITQAVFIILARKASVLRYDKALSSWLFQAARLTTNNFIRSEIRRQRREQVAFMQSVLNEPEESVWPRIAPLLDGAVAALNEKDRQAIVLRFYDCRNLSEVGAVLGLSEAATKKRLARALEKLERYFARRGVTSTAATLAEAISAHSIQAAPLALAKTVTAVAAAKGATASVSTLTLMKGALKTMAWTKVKTAITTAAIVLLAAGTTTVAIKVASAGDRSVREQVLEIVRTSGTSAPLYRNEAAKIARIGPRALPILERLIRWKRSIWIFTNPIEHENMRFAAMGIVSALGPAAVRPLTGALCDAVTNLDFLEFEQNSVNSGPAVSGLVKDQLLLWSVPDSPQATAVLTNAFLDTAEWQMPGQKEPLYDGDMYTRLPGAVALLVHWLSHSLAASSAAESLGSMGTNAVAAIPSLINVATLGINSPQLGLPAGPPVFHRGKRRVHLHMTGMATWERTHNQKAAMAALGNIGIASPEVLEMLQKNLQSNNNGVRLAALKCSYALHQPPAEPLLQTLDHFTPRRDQDFEEVVSWVGSLGENGRTALPWLQRLTDWDYVANLPSETDTNAYWYVPMPVERLRASVLDSIAQIQPAQIGSTSAPDHPPAAQTPKRNEAGTGLDQRMDAAYNVWQKTGNPANILDLATEALTATNSPSGAAGQIMASELRRIGAAARPAVPALTNALWHREYYIRMKAGAALQEIAPEELPAIH
jgi:RNA polymerase sigma factor (sigma-70 family)